MTAAQAIEQLRGRLASTPATSTENLQLGKV